MNSRLLVALVFGLTLGCGPCGGALSESDAGGPTDDRVILAIEVVENAEANPAHTAVVLEAAGLTVSEFQDIMAEIASDEALSHAFIQAQGE
jgi:hypothetical protein